MSVADRIAAQWSRIRSACDRAGRDAADVTLVAVSKAHPVDAIVAAYDAGQRDFGESYVQEFRDKLAAWPADRPGVRWHFIGHLQSNKAKDVVGRVATIHAVDRPSLVRALARRSESQQDVLVEVNVSGEASKHGCAPADVASVVDAVRATSLRPVGLMTIAPFDADPETARPHFAALREIRDRVQASLPPAEAAAFVHLSMGMSNDVEVAVEEGATIVRVGTAIFGPRNGR